MNNATLALDLGTSCGWAYKLGETIISGVWDLRPRRFEGGGMRFVRFAGYLRDLHNTKPIGAVYFEEVRAHRGVDAAHVYGGLMGTLTAWCEENKVPYLGVSVAAIKKFATGKGRASKDEVIAAMEALGYRPSNDDQADALALLLLQTDGI